MGKYRHTYTLAQPSSKRGQIHNAWRIVGCLLMIVFPILGYNGAVYLVRENSKQNWVPIPGELFGSFVIPNVGRVYYLDLAVTVLLMALGFTLLMIFYSVVYRIFMPSSYQSVDVPSSRSQDR
jgi:hypothetical protein